MVPDVPVETPKPLPDNRDPRDKNNELSFAAVRGWAKDKGYDEAKTTAILQRLALALVTESSGGYIYANDGGAYDYTKKTQWNEGLSQEVQTRVAQLLRKSLSLPYDRVGRNGRSTGMLQQISLEANKALSPDIKWGWGSMAETMNPESSALMFVKQLRVTDDPVYKIDGKGYTTVSPIIADVLRVQQPLVSEALGTNYSQKNLNWALGIVANPSSYHTRSA